jgi:hypothetical protein
MVKPNNFLSNFFPTLVGHNDRFYSSVEVAYQALKFKDTPFYEGLCSAQQKSRKQ